MIHRRFALVVLPAALILAVSACSPGSDEQTDAGAGGTATSDTAPGSGAPEEPAATDAPVEVQTETVPAACPYLDQEIVEGTVGQKVSTVLVTTTSPPSGPLPKCEFQRSSGEPAAVVDTVTIAAGEGLATSLELVPGGNPAGVGEGGSVMVHQGQDRTDLAAFSGSTMVTVTINQESSLEAVDLAEYVLAAAG